MLKKVRNSLRKAVRSKRSQAEGQKVANVLLNQLETCPIYHFTFSDNPSLGKFIDDIGDYCIDKGISAYEVYNHFVPPWEEFILAADRCLIIAHSFDTIEGINMCMCRVFFNEGFKDNEYMFFEASVIHTADDVHLLLNNVTHLKHNIFYPLIGGGEIESPEVVEEMKNLVNHVSDVVSCFVNAMVFSRFVGNITEIISTKKGKSKPSNARNRYRFINTVFSHTKQIRLSGKRKSWKLSKPVDMPKGIRYLRHEKYSFDDDGNKLPLQFDLEGKPYYKVTEVKQHVRGKDLPGNSEKPIYKA